MSYVDYEYYKDTFQGTVLDESNKHKLERSSDQIDSLTFNRIRAKGFDNLTDFQKDKIRKAVCILPCLTFSMGVRELISVPYARENKQFF